MTLHRLTLALWLRLHVLAYRLRAQIARKLQVHEAVWEVGRVSCRNGRRGVASASDGVPRCGPSKVHP